MKVEENGGRSVMQINRISGSYSPVFN